LRHLDAAALRQRLPWAALVHALRQLHVQGCEAPLRQTHQLGKQGHVLLMPAWQAGKYFGIKTVAIFPGNGTIGLPAVNASYALFDANTGVLLAQMDGSELTALRTAATAALATRMLAREDATRLLIVGAGRVASLLAPALRCARPQVLDVTVWARKPAAAQALATQLCAQGFDAHSSADLQAAAGRADIISCATLATTPLICGDWLDPGTHLNLIGSFTPEMCEADAACLSRGRVFVDSNEALHKAGEIVQAVAQKRFDLRQVQGNMQALCRGEIRGRASPDAVTVFKSVGSALQDLAAASLAMLEADNEASCL
jgi:ornithine cyclodeaminase/alanine dehydrogenase-like protein (mu-crystallin family)